jgi:hypothetical protein
MIKTLWLNENRDVMFRNPKDDFVIRKMKNTTKFKIGETISEGVVSGLLGVKHGYSWDIIIEGKR